MRALLPKAIEVLAEELKAPDPIHRLTVALAVLKFARSLPLAPEAQTEATLSWPPPIGFEPGKDGGPGWQAAIRGIAANARPRTR
jgi:hypothetical protein